MNVCKAAPRLERAGKTPSQRAILWLLRHHGRVRYLQNSREFRWYMSDGIVTVSSEGGPWEFLQSCGAMSLGADGLARLTPAGHAVCARYRKEPAIVKTGRAPEVVTWLNDQQMERVTPLFPLSHGITRLDDRSVLSAIVHALRYGLRWHNIPSAYGLPYRRVRNRMVRWAELGVLDQILAHLLEHRNGVWRLMVAEDDILSHPTGAMLAERGYFPILAPVEDMPCAT